MNMPFFDFLAEVEGSLEARDEEEARMILRADLGKHGSVDIIVLEVVDDEDEGFDDDEE